jgi:hypothetical protein
MWLIIVVMTIWGEAANAHETCFWKHQKYGPYYGMIKAEIGERLVIVAPFNKDDEYILVQGFVMVHEYPDGIAV